MKMPKALLDTTVLTVGSDADYHYKEELNKLVYVLRKVTPLLPCASVLSLRWVHFLDLSEFEMCTSKGGSILQPSVGNSG